MAEHWALSVDPDYLRRMLANLRHVASPYYRRQPCTAAVRFLFGVGSTTAGEIIRRAGFDPATTLKEVGYG